MDRVFVVKIIHPKNAVFKNLWAFAEESKANDKAKEMNDKGFENVRYEVESVRFQDEEINEDDF